MFLNNITNVYLKNNPSDPKSLKFVSLLEKCKKCPRDCSRCEHTRIIYDAECSLLL